MSSQTTIANRALLLTTHAANSPHAWLARPANKLFHEQLIVPDALALSTLCAASKIAEGPDYSKLRDEWYRTAKSLLEKNPLAMLPLAKQALSSPRLSFLGAIFLEEISECQLQAGDFIAANTTLLTGLEILRANRGNFKTEIPSDILTLKLNWMHKEALEREGPTVQIIAQTTRVLSQRYSDGDSYIAAIGARGIAALIDKKDWRHAVGVARALALYDRTEESAGLWAHIVLQGGKSDPAWAESQIGCATLSKFKNETLYHMAKALASCVGPLPVLAADCHDRPVA